MTNNDAPDPHSDRYRGQQALFIINPVAGGLPPRDSLDRAIAAASAEFGLDALIEQTAAPGHATTLAAQAEADGVPLCFVVGGDGTFNEALNGLTTTDLTLGLIPAGTADVWAKEAAIPRRPLAALRAQLAAGSIEIDCGRAGVAASADGEGRRFLLMASYGLDAAAIAAVAAADPRWKRRFGRLTYLVGGLRTGFRYPGFEIEIAFDDAAPVPLASRMLVIGNTRSYGGLAAITSQASAVDGRLDCVGLRGRGLGRNLAAIPQVLFQRHLRASNVLFQRAQRIRLLSDAPLPPMQIDGDAIATSAAELTIEPAALRLFVPGAAAPVFQPRDPTGDNEVGG
jgi:YegS/Rv2252/BmrU family lipid kinase